MTPENQTEPSNGTTEPNGNGGAAPAKQGWFLRLGHFLRKETVGGFLLVIAAALGLIVANSPLSDLYVAVRQFEFGFESLHLNLSVQHWASDGLLAIFFFLVGLELKREFIVGDLRSPSKAIVPVAAAFGGVLVPALIFLLANGGLPTAHGWAIPTATDIAFAVAVLAVIGPKLPSALRIFLLTLAVVDDLIAITIIAIFYTRELQLTPLLLALIPLAIFFVLAHFRPAFFGNRTPTAWLILLPIGAVVWALVHASGVHATVAGVLLGFAVRVRVGPDQQEDEDGLSAIFEHRFRPLSSGLAVPLFAFFSAGVVLSETGGLVALVTDPVTIGIVGGLVLGKPIGILLTTVIITKITRAELDPTIKVIDMLGIGLLAGIGFTVSLLVAELSFGLDSPHLDHAKVAILAASVLAAGLAAAVLVPRNRMYAKQLAKS